MPTFQNKPQRFKPIQTKLFICMVALIATGLFTTCTPGSEDLSLPNLWGEPFAGPSWATATPFQPVEDISTPEDLPDTLWISPAVPDDLRRLADGSGLELVDTPEAAAYRLEVLIEPSATLGMPTSTWIYALVAPFPEITDEVSAIELRRAWTGDQGGPFAGVPLLMDETTLAALADQWGDPGNGAVRTLPADQLLETAWMEMPAWAIVPFEVLEPRWKVLAIDGQSPIRNDFDPDEYPLNVTFALPPAAFSLPPSNRDASKLTTVVMTGVTALVRSTALKMETKGVTYPGVDLRDILRQADILHISNEIPFAPECPYPDPYQTRLIFCSDPKYIELLEDIGVDVIELTGNHFQDWGSQATLYTLDMYRQRGWPYFGGGEDLQDSRQPVLIEHQGNKLAFIGCNSPGPTIAWATDYQPGAAPCDDYTWMTAEITRLRQQGYLPIATFQYAEYYTPEPRPQQRTDFRLMADAGALIVSGSQAHNAQAMEFYDGTFIHYGLGNLFFDQMAYTFPNGPTITSTRQEFLDRHVFYDGEYISTELLTAMLEDYARPRPMSLEERAEFLQYIFSESGWIE